MAAPTVYMTVVKRFLYRGDANEEFSNSYALTGETPANSTAWRALFDALVTQEKTLYDSSVKVIKGYGYDGIPSTGDSAIWTVDLRVAPNTVVSGTYSTASALALSGDTAVWLRWGLDRFTSPGGKRVYLRKYIHPGYADPGVSIDTTAATWRTAAAAFGAKLDDGSFLDGRKITDALGTATVGHAACAYVTTRTLKRRSKRATT